MTHTGRVWAWTAAVGAAGLVVLALLWSDHGWARPAEGWWALPLFSLLLAAAERMRIRVRVGTQVDAANLVEAVLAPLLFSYPGVEVVAVVAGAEVISSLIRRGPVVKNAFNTAQWVLASGCGALVMQHAGGPYGTLDTRRLLVLLGAVAAVSATNIGVFFVVLALARGKRMRDLAVEMKRVILVVWVGSWGLNVAIGFLYVFGFAASPASLALFAVPLVVLHLAYRGLAAVTADQQRLAGLHEAASALASPVDPLDGIPAFLESVARCFQSASAELVLDRGEVLEAHLWTRSGYSLTEHPARTATMEATLLSLPGPVRLTRSSRDPVGTMLRERGWNDCLTAPLAEDGRRTGCLMVLDQNGVEGSSAGELAVLEAVARETAGTFSKGRMLADVLEERRKLAELIGATSDGMLSLDRLGAPLAWNPALERITGVPAADALGSPAAVLRLRPRTLDGQYVDLTRWPALAGLPAELRINAADGTVKRLSCSFSRVAGDAGAVTALVVVARDVTAAEEMEALREEFDRLTEQQLEARSVVEQLQQAVVPPAPDVPGVEFGVEYVPTEELAPTGGDLYDWHLLPDGDLHLAVVDVMGHGVAATKAALSVIHTLRVVAAEGVPVGRIIGRVDALMQVQEPDLAATAIVGRYTPATGRLVLASGGHPPALVMRSDGSVALVEASGSPIGWPGAGSDGTAELVLDVGETLLLYTDGLVEARKDMLQGLESLVSYSAGAGRLPTAELPPSLVARMLAGAERRDDTLALALRRTMSAERFHTVLERSPAGVRSAHSRLGRWLAGLGFDADDAEAAAAEMLANAARAARTSVHLDAGIRAGRLEVEVTDDGPGDPLLSTRGLFSPGGEAEDGRGLFIVRSLCPDLEVKSSPTGTTMRATMALRDRGGARVAGADGHPDSAER